MIKKLIPFFAVFIFCSLCSAQDEFVSWTSVNFILPINDKVQVTLLPTHRRNQDFANHQNSSYDFIVKIKASDRWSFQALQRTFFVPNNIDSYVIFLDANYHFKPWGKFKFKSGIRYHLGLDIDQAEADMLRFRPVLSYPLSKDVNIFIGNDWFYRFNDLNKIWQVRYQAGINKKFNQTVSLNVQYWNQRQLNREISTAQNIFVTTLNFRLK